MKTINLFTALRGTNLISMLPFIRDWQVLVRFHFLYAALESGLLDALREPATRDDLLTMLNVQRPEILNALLEVGLATGEVAQRDEYYVLKGRRARSLTILDNDALAALVQANVSYYNDVYRGTAEQLHGAPPLELLTANGTLVSRVSRIAEPYLRAFVRQLIRDHNPATILEIGCGSGAYLRHAAETQPNLTGQGLEIDESVADQAHTNLSNWGMAGRFQVLVGDIRQPPPELTSTFDLVTMYNLIYYILEDDRPALFQLLRDRLNPGGALALVSTFQSNGADISAANLNMATSAMAGCTPLPKLGTLQNQIIESGFEQVEITQLMPGSALYGLLAH